MTTIRDSDAAVRKIKRLPLNRNARAQYTVYQCGKCTYNTTDLTVAWAHSSKHSPWPEHDGGTILNVVYPRNERRKAKGLVPRTTDPSKSRFDSEPKPRATYEQVVVKSPPVFH